MNRRNFLKLCAGAYGSSLIPYSSSDNKWDEKLTSNRPNFLVILSDQQHWQAIGFQNKFFETPNLDRLSLRSFVFENAFCTTPQCSPSRSSIMTGFYPHKTGVLGNIGASGGNPLQMETIGSSLKNTGYETGYFGKWHLGDNKLSKKGWKKQKIVADDNNTTALGKKFLDGQKKANKPFALFLSYINPHDIYKVIPDSLYLQSSTFQEKIKSIKLPISWHKEMFENKPEVQQKFMSHNQGTRLYRHPKEEWQFYKFFYKEKVKLFDKQVGQILSALKQARLYENTVILITSDHGDMDTNHKLIFKGPFMYEHMVRIPLILKIPERYDTISTKRLSDYNVMSTDIVPTIRDFAELENTETDGHSLIPLLSNSDNTTNRDYVISQYYGKQQWVTPIRMIRTKDWKYNKYIRYEDELYHLKNDPYELNNLVNDSGYKKIRKELLEELNQWMIKNKDPFYSYHATKMGGINY